MMFAQSTIISTPFVRNMALVEKASIVLKGAESQVTDILRSGTVEHAEELDRRVKSLSASLDFIVC